ncbi:MAG: alpha/beta hydrolase [Acidobacteria bacterium]|nr:MAG: alpha/beta hydrolase [Acidobacteriota bacterium]PYQ83871.1 MAG: alpha/beta hydrolase [Acidobacteriota bacterium]PYQ87358.1 MAG: alpha/beta hydrolase [Acidobacteriota bacterium]PYR07496.1 MAG: alpha/beta hydrolase [Acidobacteriota bacterium]
MVFEVHGIQLHWEETGEGEPLLWLHGGMGAGADWKYIFEDPPEGYRLIAPDLRGHGATANPSGAFTFRQCALDVLALVRHLGIPRIKAIGLSGGGITLLHAATLQPSAVESMVVISAPPYFPPEARVTMRQFSETAIGEAEMARMRQRHKYGDAQLRQLVSMARGFADSYDDVNFTPPYLSTIAAETLIVFGDRDPLYPVSLAIELRRAIPRSYLWVVPNGGHGPVFGDLAPRFRETALAFLRGEWRQKG